MAGALDEDELGRYETAVTDWKEARAPATWSIAMHRHLMTLMRSSGHSRRPTHIAAWGDSAMERISVANSGRCWSCAALDCQTAMQPEVRARAAQTASVAATIRRRRSRRRIACCSAASWARAASRKDRSARLSSRRARLPSPGRPPLARSAGHRQPRRDYAHRPAATASAVLAWWTAATRSAGASCAWPGRPGRTSPVRAPARARPAAAAMAGANPSLNAAAEV